MFARTSGSRRGWSLIAATALFASSTHAGDGTVDGDLQTINLTVLFRYPPTLADVEEAKTSIEETSRILCDITEGQVRLGTIKLRSSACDDCGFNVANGDIHLSPSENCAAANGSGCAKFDEMCSALGKSGTGVFLSRCHLSNPVSWAHELGHYVFNLNDAYPAGDCRVGSSGEIERPPYAPLLPCSDIDQTTTSIMLAFECGGSADYTELTTDATFPPLSGLGFPCLDELPCADEDDVFGPPPLCDPDLACDYTICYDGYHNEHVDERGHPRCKAFDPSSCEYVWPAHAWWSYYHLGEVVSELEFAAKTMQKLNGGVPFFTTIETGVPDPWVPPGREAFCTDPDYPNIVDEIDLPNQVMLLLDRSGSMYWPEGPCEQTCCEGMPCGPDCDTPACCGQCPASWESRMKKLKRTVTNYLELVREVPLEGIEVGVMSFDCDVTSEVELRPVTDDSYDDVFVPAINDLTPGGRTSIADALHAAGQSLGGGSGKAVFLVTDGFENCSESDVDTAILELKDLGVNIYAISFGASFASTQMMKAAEATRGNYMSVPIARELGPAFSRQWAALVNAGLVIPQLPYAVWPFGTTEPPSEARGIEHWLAGDDDPPGDPEFPYRSNTFNAHVEEGTEKLIVSLAGTMDDMSKFAVRALLDGPPGPNPTHYDTEVPDPLMSVFSRSYYLLFEIQDPNPGTWRIAVEANPEMPDETVHTGYITVMSRAGEQRVFASLDKGVVEEETEGVELSVVPRFQSMPIGNAHIFATLVRPDGSVVGPLDMEGGVLPGESYLGFVDPADIALPGLYEVRVGCWVQNGDSWASWGPGLPEVDVPTFRRAASRYFVATVDSTTTSVMPQTGVEPGTLQWAQPSPFRGTTLLNFTLPTPSDATLTVYDVAGRVVRVLVDDRRGQGVHTARWDGRDDRGSRVASGMYLVKLVAGGLEQTTNVVFLGD